MSSNSVLHAVTLGTLCELQCVQKHRMAEAPSTAQISPAAKQMKSATSTANEQPAGKPSADSTASKEAALRASTPAAADLALGAECGDGNEVNKRKEKKKKSRGASIDHAAQAIDIKQGGEPEPPAATGTPGAQAAASAPSDAKQPAAKRNGKKHHSVDAPKAKKQSAQNDRGLQPSEEQAPAAEQTGVRFELFRCVMSTTALEK